LAKVEVDEMARLVGDIAPEVATDDAMPGRIVFLVEFLLYVGSYVLFYVEFFQRLRGAVHSVLLHFLRHVRILDDSFSIRHFLWMCVSGGG